ncbi:MAG: 50S ribosomal protein L17 [Gammaproteobacteria bacterium]
MRHRHGRRKLNVTDHGHRRALLRNLGNALLRHERIKTTLPRAKELRRFIEPLITLGRNPLLANRRIAFAKLRDRDSVVKLFGELAERCKDRPGGYLRILKCGTRPGDAAPMAFVQLTDAAVESEKPDIEKPADQKPATE